MRIVIDSNVLVSAAMGDGKPRQLLLKALSEHTVVTSRLMLAEVADVLARDKFTFKGTQLKRYLSILKKNSKIVGDNPIFKLVLEDSDDDVVLNVAYAGKANFIVTGDKHLLAFKKFKQAEIVTVARMLEILS